MKNTEWKRNGLLVGWLLGMEILMGGGPALGQTGTGNGGQPQLGINVRVHNYAQVSIEILTLAEVAAAEILGKAGVEVTWTNCDPARADHDEAAGCNQLLGPTNLAVRILPYIGVFPGTSNKTMGFAVGDLASVSFRRIREEAAESGVQPYEVLSPALAHEIGHVLLGQRGHSPNGIMRARWRREDYERAPRGAFKFTAEQAQSMRTEVRSRGQRQAGGQILRMTIRVHDYAGVNRDTVERTEREVTRILGEAGISTAWVDCPLTASELDRYPACLQPTDSPRFDLNIVPHFMATRVSMPDTTLGFTSLSKDGERAYEASVFYDRVREEAETTRGSLPRILGHAIAHELGHLLLRASGHSSEGIMRARWTPEDFRHVACGQLLFTPEQADLIRREVRERAADQAAAEVTTSVASK